MEKALERFLHYVSFDTQSIEDSDIQPSNPKEWVLAKALQAELLGLGVEEVKLDQYGYVYAKLWSETAKGKTLGLIAHMDTSPDAKGEGVSPLEIPYQGDDIVLASGLRIPARDLVSKIGHRLIVTNGETLLGADDKAGVAIIMSVVERWLAWQEEKPNLFICFTPDEEVGRGTEHFDDRYFQKDAGDLYTYTVDGGEINEIESENFNAASARIIINGQSIHPGSAKDRMVNAQVVAVELFNQLPSKERPEHTSGYEGFYHLTHIAGTVEKAEMSIIIRDFDFQHFAKRKSDLQSYVAQLNHRYGEGTIICELRDDYQNMKRPIMEKPSLLSLAKDALRAHNIEPSEQPIRGGTDGARLSYLGIPCPNLGTGGANFHGPREFLDVDSFLTMIEVIWTLAQNLLKEQSI